MMVGAIGASYIFQGGQAYGADLLAEKKTKLLLGMALLWLHPRMPIG
jgi:hypothetical protein